MLLDFMTPNIAAKTGSKRVRYRQHFHQWCKNLNHAWTRNEGSGSKYGLSDKDCIGWLIEHFIEYIVPGRPYFVVA